MKNRKKEFTIRKRKDYIEINDQNEKLVNLQLSLRDIKILNEFKEFYFN